MTTQRVTMRTIKDGTHLQDWLEPVANAQTHFTTGQVPRSHFEAEERSQLRPYAAPETLLSTRYARSTKPD